ncbi:MAG: 4-hydroxythreonine-4-phosphate dehydrogenase PdxA, partial [Bacteroidales bacterium]|nr:4-hydroxythreonine-4-phosphate dehydrogenase PdxA [Bacteroidales bacterium]
MAENRLYKIGLTHGDINGTGYEVIMKALADPKMSEVCTSVIYGLAKVATYHRKTLDLPDFSIQFVKSLDQVSLKKCNLINLLDQEVKIALGKETEVAGELAQLSLAAACKDAKEKKIDAIVTAPVNFNIFPSENNRAYYAHIDYMSQYFSAKDCLQMLVSDRLKIGIAASHLTISKVAEVLTQELLLQKIKIMNDSLSYDFGIMKPKIAVLAMHP